MTEFLLVGYSEYMKGPVEMDTLEAETAEKAMAMAEDRYPEWSGNGFSLYEQGSAA